MAYFEAPVVRLTIKDHPDADSLEIAEVGGFQSIVGKGGYQTGDLAVYIPEGAVVPDWAIEKMGLTGRLAGKRKNRVKAIRLRGVLSQGLIYGDVAQSSDYGPEHYVIGKDGEDWLPVREGDDVGEYLELIKYEPPIPKSMSGNMFNATREKTLGYDIENIKKYPDVLLKGELVSITEKLHGTWACFGRHVDKEGKETYIVTSKGLSGRGLAFKLDDPDNETNLYVQMFRKYEDAFEKFRENTSPELSWYVLGEIFGKGVQDLHYGIMNPDFRAFDLYLGNPGHGNYVGFPSMYKTLKDFFPIVPTLALSVPWSPNLLDQFTGGKTTLEDSHTREGVVIRPDVERQDRKAGRVIFKSISEEYLLRKGGTEFN